MGTPSRADIPHQVRHLIRPAAPVRLAILALKAEVRWWIQRHSASEPQTWVLQPSLRGPVWRLERYTDRHKDILAVSILHTLHDLDAGEASGVEEVRVGSEPTPVASPRSDSVSRSIRRTVGWPSVRGVL